MSEALTTQQTQLKKMVQSESVQERLQQCLGKRANQFATSLLSLTANDPALQRAEPGSVLTAAMTAATLDLPIQKDLGFAWVIGYRDNKAGKTLAQFQMGYKGFIQLAQRTGQYRRMNASPVNQKAWNGYDDFGEPCIDWKQYDPNDEVAGYFFGFELVNGFQHRTFWSVDEVQYHANRYSQSYRKNSGPWASDFDAMALKTVIKNTLNKWGYLSVEMQKAFSEDQGVRESPDENTAYIDNGQATETTKAEAIDAAKSVMAAKPAESPNKADYDEPKQEHAEKPESAQKQESGGNDKPSASQLTLDKACNLIGVPKAMLGDYLKAQGYDSWTNTPNSERQWMIDDSANYGRVVSAWQDAQDNQ